MGGGPVTTPLIFIGVFAEALCLALLMTAADRLGGGTVGGLGLLVGYLFGRATLYLWDSAQAMTSTGGDFLNGDGRGCSIASATHRLPPRPSPTCSARPAAPLSRCSTRFLATAWCGA